MKRFRIGIAPTFGYSLALVVFCTAIFFSTNANGQDATSKSALMPVTTADVEIPVENLNLLLKPLTQDELVVEADGWRDLLKKKVQDIATIRIRLKSDKQVAQKKADTAQQAVQPQSPATNAPNNTKVPSPKNTNKEPEFFPASKSAGGLF